MPLYLAHRLFRGDATDAAFVARCLGGQPADLVFTDPPYNVSYGAHGGAEALPSRGPPGTRRCSRVRYGGGPPP